MHSYYESAQPDDVFDKIGFHVPTMESIHTQISMISHNTIGFLYDIPGSMHESLSAIILLGIMQQMHGHNFPLTLIKVL